MKQIFSPCLALLIAATAAFADPPVIENVELRPSGEFWTVSVTLSHPDTGWEDYADGWRVLTPEGEELGLRVLHHPHVNEQPFTRSLGSVEIPAQLREIAIEARDSVGGWSGAPVLFPVPR